MIRIVVLSGLFLSATATAQPTTPRSAKTLQAAVRPAGGGRQSPSQTQAELLRRALAHAEAERLRQSEQDRQREEQRQAADLAAQQAMATWAARMFWAALLQALAAILGIVLVARTLIHTRRAANFAGAMVDEARLTTQAAVAAGVATRDSVDLAIRAQRPWVALSAVPALNLNVEPGRATLGVSLTVHNRGSTPATNVEARFIAWKSSPGGPDGHQARKADLVRTFEQNVGTMGFSLFPNEAVTQVYGLEIEGLSQISPNGGPVWLIAAVRYNFPSGVGLSTIVQFVWKRDPSDGSTQEITSADHSIPASSIFFHRMGLHETAD